MPQQKSTNTNNHWDKLDALLAYAVEPEGEGWFTSREYQERYNVSETTANRRLRTLRDTGKLIKWGEGHKTKYCLKPTQ